MFQYTMQTKERGSEWKSVNLHRSPSMPFVLVFVFTPGGTVVLSGDINTIQEYCSDLPPCHCVIHFYINGRRVRHAWDVLGKNTACSNIGYSAMDGGLTLIRASRRSVRGMRLFAYRRSQIMVLDALDKHVCNREKYFLIWASNTQNMPGPVKKLKRYKGVIESKENVVYIVHSWRKLPEVYLNQLKQFSE